MNLSLDGSTLTRVGEDDILDGSFKIPSSVTSIGNYAFWECTNLKQITIPKGVTSIGRGAFGWCIRLKQITIPQGVISIGSGAFWGCKNLEQVTIPEGVTSIAFRTFAGCINLKQITIPDSVTSIDEHSFDDCYALQTIFVEGLDEHKRETIIQLLPENLKNKVVLYSESELKTLWNQELSRVTNAAETNPLYPLMLRWDEAGKEPLPNEILVQVNHFMGPNNPSYQQALATIKEVPLPRIQDGIGAKQAYENKLKEIVDNYIRHEPNNYSFILNALTAMAAVTAVALVVAALVAAFIFAPSITIPLAVAGVVYGAVAAGTFFYRSSTMSKDEPECANTLKESLYI